MSSPFADRSLMLRAAAALVAANGRYWPTVAPRVHSELSRWERRALAIPDRGLRELACQKLRHERFNAEVSATLATLAPRSQRDRAVDSIVALQVMYDYLDALTEQPLPDPIGEGRRLFGALEEAVSSDGEQPGDYFGAVDGSHDGGYLRELVAAVRRSLAEMPSAAAVREVARRGAERCSEAQIRVHAAPRLGNEQLERWARERADGTGLDWREFLAGATASVLALHALMAAAADRLTTPRQALETDTLYMSIGAMTMLDSIVDYEHDLEHGRTSYVQLYGDIGQFAQSLSGLTAEAVDRARGLPNGAHHVMTLVGVAAYYTSDPAARTPFAEQVTARVRSELQPLMAPTLALMRAWRAARRFGNQSAEGANVAAGSGRWRDEQGAHPPRPVDLREEDRAGGDRRRADDGEGFVA